MANSKDKGDFCSSCGGTGKAPKRPDKKEMKPRGVSYGSTVKKDDWKTTKKSPVEDKKSRPKPKER